VSAGPTRLRVRVAGAGKILVLLPGLGRPATDLDPLAALLVAARRVIIDAHYLSDVIVGGYLGVVSAWALAAAAKYNGFELSDNPRSRGAAEPDRSATAPAPTKS